MPITRERLGSTVKSSTTAAKSKGHNFVSSEDDLFERSASQSASRQTRTINHIVPKEVSKKLSHDFEAVSGKASQNIVQEDKENNLKGNSRKSVTGSLGRPLVKRAVSKASHTSSHSPTYFKTAMPNQSSSATKIPLPARREIVNLDGGADDPIFDVPLSSPSPPKISIDMTVSRATIKEEVISTPTKSSKLSTLANSTLITRSPSVTILAESRRTPLTWAEKKRRQSEMVNGNGLDKSTRTNISALKVVKRDTEVEKVANVKQEIVEIDTENGTDLKVEEIKNITDETVQANSNVVDEIAQSALSKNQANTQSIADIVPENVKSTTIDVDESFQSTANTKNHPAGGRKKRIFIRNPATESAPPELNVTSRSENVPSVPVEAENGVREASLVIQVPPPPKLEDLETLDPELYVKLKSGSLKDDPTVPFISESDRIDIENFLESFTSPELAKNLLPVAIIGEGTFSTVYKVIDKNFYECDNSSWLEYSRQNPLDWLKLWRWVYNQEPVDKFVLFRDGKRCVDRYGRSVNGARTMTAATSTSIGKKSKLAVLLRRYLLEWAGRSLDSLLPSGQESSEGILASISPRALQSAMLRFRPYFIALKRINATSSPQRILDEMSFLKHLGGKNNVVPLINGLRCEDQVLVTFPYFCSDDFREFISMQNVNINSIACYMRCLFISLAHLHAHHIIHRDVKPSNFLYAPEGGGRAVLLDFGLAQKASSSSSNNSGGGRNNSRQSHAHVLTSSAQQQQQLQQQRITTSRNIEKERKKLQAVNAILTTLGGSAGFDAGDSCEKLLQLTGQLGPGYFNNDPRAAMKASRAGTRGFRAPEVLFKCSNQTTALDIWSAGVILLTLLTRRYPFFHSSDDYDAIVEIANIFGNEEMAGAAALYGRKWTCNVPSVPVQHVTWPVLCEKLNPTAAPEIPEECYDLLRECLNLNSEKRITAKNALKHPFIIKYAK